MVSRNALQLVLRQLGVAAVYALLGQLALHHFAPEQGIGIFWPASGWALAVLLLGGKRYAIGVFGGALLTVLLAGAPIWIAWLVSCGATLAALAGHWLLSRRGNFDLRLRSRSDYRRLLIEAGVLSSGISAWIGVTSQTVMRALPAEAYFENLMLWWCSDGLGVMLVTPLVLIWRHTRPQWAKRKLWLEGALILSLGFLLGQVIFHGWLSGTLGMMIYQGYWLFILAAWAAVRLGTPGVTIMVCIAAVQYILGIRYGGDTWMLHGPAQLVNSWVFLAALSVIGMSLAIFTSHRREIDTSLHIAAAAFECQEGMIVTDAQMRILRTNKSFARIMGYSNEEVVGQTTTFMRSDRHPPSFYENAWRTGRERGIWNDEVWHRRKNGEVFPQWLTCTAVKNENGVITNYVVTHTDISYRKQQEAERQATQLAQRDALVREVHHRIKNNLQGISGLLRLFAQENPQTTEAINQVMSQIRSIAVLHGLQGHTSMDTVRLCELTSAIAADVQSVWQTPIGVDIPALWTPGIIAEKEAVPIALVLNELLVNAVKHGGKAHGHVSVTLRKGAGPEDIQVTIRNSGHLRSNTDRPTAHHAGLQLIASLMPREGATLTREQLANEVLILLEISPPVLHLEKNPT